MKNIRAASITLAVISMLLGGCAATPQASLQDDAAAKQFESTPSTAIVYLYRADYPSNVGFPVLWLDNRLIGELTPASYFRVSVRPGKNLLTAYAGDNGRLEFETRSGEVYFVAITSHGDGSSSSSAFRSVTPDVGRAQIQKCCALLDTWKPGQTRMPL